MATEKPTEQQTTTETTENAAPTREEFAKLATLVDALGANLRKEREAAAKRTGGLEEQWKGVAEKLSAIEAAKGGQVDQAGAGADPKLAAYEAKLKEMEGRLETERKAREQVEQARMSQERRTALANGLTGHGVTGPHLEAAIAFMYDAKQLVVHDEKGQVGIKMTRAGYDEVVPIDVALEELLRQDSYKIFIPARSVGGSGTTPGGMNPTQRRTDGKMSQSEALAALPNLFKAQYR